MTATVRAPRIVAVVPLYRPSPEQVAALALLAQQVDRVVAVDDGSGDAPSLSAVHPAVQLVRSPSNEGIARSLNVGVRLARESGATHVLTLDQDSRLPDGYVARALAALARLGVARVAVGGVGAGRIGPHRVEGAPVGVGDVRDGTDGVQSGWLLPIDLFDAIGLFDERLFIDCVDVDFVMRAALAGRPILVTDECAIEHSLGSQEHAVRVLGRRIVYSQHPAFRRYYITRNRVVMLKRYGTARPRVMLGQFAVAARIATMCLVLGRDRRAQVVAVWAGALHGLAGRSGRIPERIRRAVAPAV